MKFCLSAISVITMLVLSGCAGTQTYALSYMGATASATIGPDGKEIYAPVERVVVRGVDSPCATQRVIVRAAPEVVTQRVVVRAVEAPCATQRVVVRAIDSCGTRGVSRVASNREVQRAVEHNYKVDRDATDERSMWSAFIGKTFGYHRKYRTVIVAE